MEELEHPHKVRPLHRLDQQLAGIHPTAQAIEPIDSKDSMRRDSKRRNATG